MTEFAIREMTEADRAAWAAMRHALWPEASVQEHASDVEVLLDTPDAWGFIAEAKDGRLAGFAEVALRNYANGCASRPVPFLEGIWVKAEFRRQGLGRALIAHIEAFLAARGFHELGSDAYLDDTRSHDAHKGWGFEETERVVYFRKVIPG
jgi:aminoglycoside 6'-N-acetyltransferase I